MPLFLKDDRAILFVHIPKTGGTSLEMMMTDAGWQMTLYEARDEAVDCMRTSPQHYHRDLLLAALRLDHVEAVFTLVRDPISRFRSEYAFRVQHADRRGADEVERWADRALAAYELDRSILDNHFRAQTDFLLDTGDVYRFEDGLPAIVADLEARYHLGLSGPVRHETQSSGTLRSVDVEVSERLESRLREVYAADFVFLGYD